MATGASQMSHRAARWSLAAVADPDQPAKESATFAREEPGASETRTVPIGSLLAGDSPRLDGENQEHVRILAESETLLPPILVNRDTMRVVDGTHRLRAAELRGWQAIDVRFFSGSEDEAFIAAVKANMAHGLPLTLADREAAAARIIASDPRRSDRWIASITGLAAATVAGIRGRVTPDAREGKARTGRDGRVRPLNSAEARLAASKKLTAHPEASLRQIAKSEGISPSTVRDVRDRMRRGDDPVPPRLRVSKPKEEVDSRSSGRASSPLNRGAPRDRAALLNSLKKDPSLRHSEAGRALLRWLDARASGPGPWQDFVDSAPPHCAYMVAELARRCAREWQDVAEQLEQQLRSMA